MKMTLAQIDHLMKQGYHFVYHQRFPRSGHERGRVMQVVVDEHDSGLDIWGRGCTLMGKNLYTVKVNKKIYEIHNSKTAHMRYLKEKDSIPQSLNINEIRYNEDTDKVECWNGFFWVTL